jgi:hypothetical protein
VTTLFGLSFGTDIAMDTAGNFYVTGNEIVRKISPGGATFILAGEAGSWGSTDGVGGVARFNQPSGVAVDAKGNVYVADRINNAVRKISPTGATTTFAGSATGAGNIDGFGDDAWFNAPAGVAIDAVDNVYVTDFREHTIRRITRTGVVTTIAGSAGNVGSADGDR